MAALHRTTEMLWLLAAPAERDQPAGQQGLPWYSYPALFDVAAELACLQPADGKGVVDSQLHEGETPPPYDQNQTSLREYSQLLSAL